MCRQTPCVRWFALLTLTPCSPSPSKPTRIRFNGTLKCNLSKGARCRCFATLPAKKQRDGVRPDPFKAVVAASRATDQPSSIAPGRNTGRSTGCVEVLLASPLSEPLGSLGIQGRETWRSRGVAALNDELSRGGLL